MSIKHIQAILFPLQCLALFTCLAPACLADRVIIINAENTLNTISQRDLRRIFLGKSDEFPNGEKATPINQATSTTIRAEFDQEVLNKNQIQITSYWSQKMFSGDGEPPKEFSGDLQVLRDVSGNKSAIGYVDQSAVNQAVKIIEVQ